MKRYFTIHTTSVIRAILPHTDFPLENIIDLVIEHKLLIESCVAVGIGWDYYPYWGGNGLFFSHF